MGVTTAMFTGISGLRNYAEGMNVIGNNISNVNTIGFKEGRTLFADMLYADIGKSSQIGRGVQMQQIQNQFTQGSFENTQNTTDLAIQGDSFFVVKNDAGTNMFTRAGAFTFNKDNVLVNPDGLKVMGFGINAANNLSNGALDEINLTAFASYGAKETEQLKLAANLDAASKPPEANATGVVALSNNIPSDGLYDVAAPKTINTNIYDAYGNAHPATMNMWQSGTADIWNWSLDVPSATTGNPLLGTVTYTPGSAGPPVVASTYLSSTPVGPLEVTLGGVKQNISLDFSQMTQNSSLVGGLDDAAVAPDGDGSVAFDPANPIQTSNFSVGYTTYDSLGAAKLSNIYFKNTAMGAWEAHLVDNGVEVGAAVPITFDANGQLATINAAPAPKTPILTFGGLTVDISGTTQFAGSSAVVSKNQDGYPTGTLAGIKIDEFGYVNATYTNNHSSRIAQIALAKFPSNDGLSKEGGTLFRETQKSGQAIIADATAQGMGSVQSNSLEQSTVDLAAQFVNMIIMQRAYSANAKTITTTDEMTQEVLNLKR